MLKNQVASTFFIFVIIIHSVILLNNIVKYLINIMCSYKVKNMFLWVFCKSRPPF